MAQFLFRKPKYPLLIETDSLVKAAKNGTELSRILKRYEFIKKTDYIIIDSEAEAWAYYVKEDIVSPMVFGKNKRWTKAKIIEFYNKARAKAGEELHTSGSISNKRVDRIIDEIAKSEDRP